MTSTSPTTSKKLNASLPFVSNKYLDDQPKVYEPSDQQFSSIKFGVERPYAAFFHPPGKGKTSITYFIYKTLREINAVKTMLIISKRRIIYDSWPKENLKWEGLGYKIATLHGPKKEEALLSKSDVYLINFEGLAWLEETLKLHKLKIEDVFDMCVIDESTGIKNCSRKSKRFQIIRRIAPRFKRRYILTGTPTPKNLLDVYGQIWFLDLGKTLGTMGQFKNEFFYPTGYMGYQWVPEDGAYEKVFERLKDIVIRYEKDPNDPELVIVPRMVELPKDAYKIYKEMEKELITYIDSNPIESVNGAVASMKCRQIANGGIYTEEARNKKGGKRKWKKVHDVKTEELVDLVEELNGMPALVAYEFNHDLERIQEAFPDIPHIGSGVSDKEATRIIDDWNKGRIPILAAHPDSVAHGLNLQGVESAVIFYGPSWNWENVDQFMKRIARQGQTATHIFVYFILAENTVDEIVKASLEFKEFNQDTFTKFFSNYYLDKKTMAQQKKVKNYKEKFEQMEVAFDFNGYHLPFYAPGQEDLFIRQFIDVFAAWTVTQHQDFHESLNLPEVFHKQPVSMFVDASRNFILNLFSAKYDATPGKFIVKDKDALKQYPKVKTKSELIKMFGNKNAAPELVKSKFSEDGEVEQSRKAQEKAEAKKESKKDTKKKASSKKASKKASAKKDTPKKAASKKSVKKAAPKKPATKKATVKKVSTTSKKDKVIRIHRGDTEASAGLHAAIVKVVPKRKSGIIQDDLIEKCGSLDHARAGDYAFMKDYINRAVKKGFLRREFADR